MRNLMFKVVLTALMIVSAKAEVKMVRVAPMLVESELNYEVHLYKGVYRCVAINSEAKKALIDSLKEKSGMSGYVALKLKLSNSETLVGTNYLIRVASIDKEYEFDIFSHKSTCVATANYRNNN